MPDRLRDIPPLRTLPYTMEAARYNHVKLALIRLGSPLEFELLDAGVDLVLDNHSWIGFSGWQEAFPLFEWTDFQATHRDSLHQPIACTLHIYHLHAGVLLRRAVEEMDALLDERLSKPNQSSPGKV